MANSSNSSASKKALEMYKKWKEAIDEVETLSSKARSNEAGTTQFRFSNRSNIVINIDVNDIKPLRAIMCFLEYEKKNKEKYHLNIEIDRWIKDVKDRIDRLEAKEKSQLAKKNMEKLEPILDDDAKVSLLEDEFKSKFP